MATIAWDCSNGPPLLAAGPNVPAMEVTTGPPAPPPPGLVSQTDQAETGFPCTAGESGMPGIPISGPVGSLAISSARTQVGEDGLPVANRAEVRFNAG